MSEGYVYVLSNDLMPGIFKIGRSKNGGHSRAAAMYSGATGVPIPFALEFEIYTTDAVSDELEVHRRLQPFRVDPKREFFRLDQTVAISCVAAVCLMDHGINVYDDDAFDEPEKMQSDIYARRQKVDDLMSCADWRFRIGNRRGVA